MDTSFGPGRWLPTLTCIFQTQSKPETLLTHPPLHILTPSNGMAGTRPTSPTAPGTWAKKQKCTFSQPSKASVMHRPGGEWEGPARLWPEVVQSPATTLLRPVHGGRTGIGGQSQFHRSVVQLLGTQGACFLLVAQRCSLWPGLPTKSGAGEWRQCF